MLPDLLTWIWSPTWSAGNLPLHVQSTGGSCQAHQHPFHELVVVASGAGRHRDAAGDSALCSGDVLLLHPHAWHAYPDGDGLRIYNCVFQPEVLAAIPALIADLGPAAGLLFRRHSHPATRPPLRLRAVEHERRELVRLLEVMIAERNGGAPGWRSALLAVFVQVLVLIGRLATPVVGGATLPSDELLDAVRRWLTERFRDPMPSLPSLATRFGLSPGYLSRRYSSRTGLGVVAHVHHMRIEEACRLLIAEDDPVTEVAMAVGFDDPAYFARIFTRLVGCPPKTYRQRTRVTG